MPTLNWIGKEAVLNHDKEVPFKLLKKVKTASVGENSQNLIIHGDNLEALKALMPHYRGRVKCMYIDPPYNTGNEGWVYNDKVNSPKITEWLGKVVGRVSEDLTRHDKWLCMMYPRLKLLRDLLSDDGVIFVSIDYNELHHLKFLLDDIFGERNYVGTLIWRKKEGGGQTDEFFVTEHEYILAFRKTEDFKWMDEKIPQSSVSFTKEDANGKYKLIKLAKWGTASRRSDRPSMYFPLKAPDGKNVFPVAPDGSEGRWRIGQRRLESLMTSGLIEWVEKDGSFYPYEKVYFEEGDIKVIKERSVIFDLAFTGDGTKELTNLFGKKDLFENPKPSELIRYLISYTTKPDSIILDSFAGSGTTAHAVLKQNDLDGGTRKFILVEMEDQVAKDITAERVKRAIKKYDYKDGFEYCELGKPLFDESGQIEKTCDFRQFAAYIYFTETQTNLDPKKIDGNFIGEHRDTEYYLLYAENQKNELTDAFIKKLKKNGKEKIIYADVLTANEDVMAAYNVTFKQIPYEVIVY